MNLLCAHHVARLGAKDAEDSRGTRNKNLYLQGDTLNAICLPGFILYRMITFFTTLYNGESFDVDIYIESKLNWFCL